MDKQRLFEMIALLSFLFIAVLASSCVNEDYDMSEGKLNLEVTAFQEGVVLPLGTTEQIKLKDLLKDVDGDVLDVGADGAYSISFSDSFDMTQELSSIKDLIYIPDVFFSEKVTFQMNDVDVSDVKVDAMEYAFEHSLSTSIDIPEITVPPISEKVEIAVGMTDFVPDASEVTLDFKPIVYKGDFMSVHEDFHLSPETINDIPFAVESSMLDNVIETNVDLDVHEKIPLHLSLPKGIDYVEDVKLGDNAAVKVTMALKGGFLESGNVIPDVTVDLHDILKLKDHEDGVVELADDFVLSEKNGYLQSKEYGISALNIKDKDWKRNEAGQLVFDWTFSVDAVGEIIFDNLMTTTRHIENDRDIDVEFTVEFVDLLIGDFVMGIDQMEISQNTTVEIHNEDIELPDAVERIGNVAFSESSYIDVFVKALNIDEIEGLDVELETLSIVFPDELVIDGADAGNKVVVRNADLAQGITKHVHVRGINLPAPVNGKISFSGEIDVEAVAKVEGKIHSAYLPSVAADDVKVVVEVGSSIEVADYQVKISEYDYALDLEGKAIKVEVPAELADLKDVAVYPEGNPEINIKINVPEMPLDLVPSDAGVNISFPQMLKFKNLPSSYNYDPAANSITLRGVLPSEINLPVEKLILTPEFDPAERKYYVKGSLDIDGGVSLSAGTLAKAEVESLVSGGKNISVVANIPELVPSTIAVDSFETTIGGQVELEIISAEDLPAELVALESVDFENVYLNVALDASDLPEIGDASLSIELAVDLPDMIKAEGADEEGNIVISGQLDNNGMIQVDPVKILALDLRGVDIKNGIKDVLVIDGSIKLANAAIDVDKWLGKDLEIGFEAGIKDVTISKVTGKVDYKVDPMIESVDLSEFSNIIAESGAEATLDFNYAHLALEIVTNLGVPVEASVELVPYYNGLPDANKTVPVTLVLNPSESADKESVTRYWLADTEERCPAGYTFVKADILRLLKDIPEKLEFRLVAGTDPDQNCILEPAAGYYLKADYLFELPLEFGEEFEVKYKTKIENLPAIVGNILSKGNKIKLAGTISNSLPLGLDLALIFLDSKGEVVPMAEGCGIQTITPCGLDGSVSNTELGIILTLKDGLNITDITTLELVFNAGSDGVTGVPVKDDAYLQAVLQLVIPEGITVDLSEINNIEK